jgi:hypothetical protein
MLLLNLWSDIIQPMRTRMSRATAVLVLLTCLVCPVLEMFDNWDHTLQTGNDTEYALVLLTLCVGAVYVLARLVVTLSRRLSATSGSAAAQCSERSLTFLIPLLRLSPALGSPPLNLRI